MPRLLLCGGATGVRGSAQFRSGWRKRGRGGRGRVGNDGWCRQCGGGGGWFIWQDDDGDATVFGATLGRGVVGHGTEFAVADGSDAAGVNAGAFGEEVDGSEGAGGGEFPVAGKPAARF